MKIEDYNEYYIQGSDHYLIPKDVFDELNEQLEISKLERSTCGFCPYYTKNKELNQKYLNAVADYETTMSELQELKLELSGYRQAILKDKEMLGLKEEKQELINLLDMFKNQQKEFIDYMNKTIEELECDDVDDEEMKGYLIQRIDTFKEILSKYKEIIGVSNENNMEKSK